MTKKAIRGLKRLEKLADFLEKKVPNKNFDMGQWGTSDELATVKAYENRLESHACGTAACAMGWAPVVFPKLLKLTASTDRSFSFFPTTKKGGKFAVRIGSLQAAREIFILTEEEASYLFVPRHIGDISKISRNRQVKRMRTFIRKRLEGYTVEARYASAYRYGYGDLAGYHWVKLP